MLSRPLSHFTLKNGKSVATILAVVLFFSLFGYWKFEDVLTKPEMCLTNQGDGIGGIGDLFTLKQEIDEKGFSLLFGDTRWSDKVGFGLSAPAPQSVYWKWNFAILLHIFSPENVYDVNGVLAFVLIGLFSFVLLRELGVSVPFSLVGSLLLTHLDLFFYRLNGHLLGLGTYYVPILLCWGAVRAGKNPTLFRLLILAILNVLNFFVNEYYGYFGIFFSYGLFLGYYLMHMKRTPLPIRKLFIWFVLSGAVFTALMSLSYPNLIMDRVISLFHGRAGEEIAIHNASHKWEDFLFYSVRKPLAFFDSSVPYIKDLVAGDTFKNDLGEFTFRIGLVIPLSILGCMLFFGCASAFKRYKKGTAAILECVIWISVAFLMFLFAVSPEKSVSLVPWTFEVAPMFRVGARAFLYIDIAAIVLFICTIDIISRVVLRNCGTASSIGLRIVNVSLFLLLVFITAVGVKDVTGDRIWNKAPSKRLPDTSIYETLKGKPKGLLLELPMYSPITHLPDSPITHLPGPNYSYMYNRTKHGFPIVNAPYSPPTNVEFRDQLHRLTKYINSLSPQVIMDLKSTGVRYVVVDKAKVDDSTLRKSPHLKLVAESGDKSIFVMKEDDQFGKKDFLEHFVYSELTFSFKGDFHEPNRNDNTYWIWCGKKGEITLRNHSKSDKKVIFSATFDSKLDSAIKIQAPYYYDTVKMKKRYTKFQKKFFVKAKSSLKISITSDASPFFGPSEPNLIFCTYNYRARTVD